jgi:hypothetical protein
MKNEKINMISAFIICILFFKSSLCALTHKSVASGNWSAASTWNAPAVPACGDSIVIQAGHTISVTNQQNYSGCGTPLKIIVYGELRFFNGSKLSLPCNSYVLVLLGGKVQADVGLSNSNYIEICNNVEWNSNSILNGLACLPASLPICASVLPVEIVGFKAELCNEDNICFNWLTATETNSNYFEVERATDDFNFRVIYAANSKAPAGNSYYTISYSGIDKKPLNGINYYRLKQVDNDHHSNYSKVISVHLALEQGLKFLVFPNPNSGEFTVQITGLKNDENITVFLRDTDGSIVYKAMHHVTADDSLLKVSSPFKLNHGSYFCSFIIDNTEYVVRIIVDNR